jgi:hypothetical protein
MKAARKKDTTIFLKIQAVDGPKHICQHKKCGHVLLSGYVTPDATHFGFMRGFLSGFPLYLATFHNEL